ncbi:MAG: NAD(P)-binding protein [Cyclobacteriaceae bacterium]
MKRRDFIKTSAITASLPFWLQACNTSLWRDSFPIEVHSDHKAGHLMMQSRAWNSSANEIKTETIIVGGGVAGVAAASQLKGKDFLLFELSDKLGGTSRSGSFEGISFAQGAHYELAYPEYYGEEVLGLLESLGIIQYESWKKMWSFVDKQHLIPHGRRQQCFENGKMRGDVIPKGYDKTRFHEILQDYKGTMALPTRLIAQEYRYLNDLTFVNFLSEKMIVDEQLKRQMSYHMLDDYGGTADQVSALAGIHYFMCRPYTDMAVDLFSPPQGNAYFVNKMLGRVQTDRIRKDHLVKKINKTPDGYEVEVLDIAKQEVCQVSCENLIYAGQKHALKYIFPEESELFKNDYAPWMVVSFIANGIAGEYGFWQNEYLSERQDFLGFIDSSVQDQSVLKGKRILTAYYCLRPEDREYLTTIPDNKERIANETLGFIEEMLDQKLDVASAFINVMGHAMPIPKPGYLFNDATTKSQNGVVYAGVDNGRLPLIYEALDSGILAARNFEIKT